MKTKKIVLNRLTFFRYLSRLGLLNLMSDETYLKKKYYLSLRKRLDFNNLNTFNEKLQWLKLYDRRDIYTTMVDKYEVKKYVADKIGEEYIIPTIGVYDKFDEIDFKQLPKQFVIKCTHDSGGLVICRDKSMFDMDKAKKTINKCLKRNYYYVNREWPYKNVKPRIIIEKYMEDCDNKTMRDYKIFCFNGFPEVMYVSDGSHTTNQTIAFFDMRYKQLPIRRMDYYEYDDLPRKPRNFKKMKQLSAILSKGIPHVRVDWYEVNGRLYFGEFTFTTCGGMLPFSDEKWDKKLGNMIDLELAKK